MSIRRLKTLIAISETGTFAYAADLVSLTPAAVSQQMKVLEDEFGVILFDRTRRSPKLNRAGHALVPKAREIVRAYESLVPSLTNEISVGEEFAIGAIVTTMSGLMLRTMRSLQATYSGLYIRVCVAQSSELYAQVDRGFLDAAIIAEPERHASHMRWNPFVEEPFLIVAPLEVPYDDPEILLQSLPYIRFSRRAWVGKLIDEWLRGRDLRIHEGMESDDLDAISGMVFNNLGISIVPKRCVPPLRPYPLKAVPLGPAAKMRRLGVLSRKDSNRSRLVDILLAELTYAVDMAGEMKALRGIDS
jgi:DNA-binding transcriptional LysR family regulator